MALALMIDGLTPSEGVNSALILQNVTDPSG
jgi:hypothetical protein